MNDLIMTPTMREIRLSTIQSFKPSIPGLLAPTSLFQGAKKVLKTVRAEKKPSTAIKRAERKCASFLIPSLYHQPKKPNMMFVVFIYFIIYQSARVNKSFAGRGGGI